MTSKEIAAKLYAFYAYRQESKEKLKEMTVELMAIAVELGQMQEDAIKGGSVTFLDGYCVALGLIPKNRDNQNPI